MDTLASLQAFVAVVDAGSFAGAARRMGMAASSLTRRVNVLESELGTILLNRSTRSVSLTEAGERYYAQVAQILADLSEAHRSVSSDEGPPRGTLRVSVPVAFSRLHIAPAVAEFLLACPELCFEFVATDSFVDLVEERIDVAIRIGKLASSSLIGRKLAPHRRVLCASPGYLDARGAPSMPEALAEHDCLSLDQAGAIQRWCFRRGDEDRELRVRGRLRANNSDLLRRAALGGAGLVLLPTWLVGRDLETGRLRRVLGDWQVESPRGPAGVYAVYLANRRGSAKVRAFVDHLAAHFGSPPYWDCDGEGQQTGDRSQ